MDKNGDKKPWENSFSDENTQEGQLSRIALRKQKGNFKLILAVLVSIVALIAIFSLAFGMSKQSDVQQSQSISKKSIKKVTKPKKKVIKSKKNNDSKQDNVQTASENTTSTQTTSNDQESSGKQTSNDTSQDSNSQDKDNAEYVTVNQSEGIYRVATNAGISVSQLQALNGLNENSVITPGQKLRIK